MRWPVFSGKSRVLGGGTRLVLGYGPSRHQLVAPLPEHQQHQQRVERELQWQLQQLERQQLLRGPARSDGRTSSSRHSRKQSIHHQRVHILSPPSREGEDKHITPMPGVPRDARLLCGAVWQHTATALRGKGRPAALRRRPPLNYAHASIF